MVYPIFKTRNEFRNSRKNLLIFFFRLLSIIAFILTWSYFIFLCLLHFKTNNNSLQNLSKQQEQPCRIQSPGSIKIDYNNIYWQRFQSSNGTFFFYNAFYDDRILNGALSTIRILSMIDRISPIKIYCRIWFSNISNSIITLADYHYIWSQQWGNYEDKILQPFLINCPFPRQKHLQPYFVSLFEKNCTEITNNLQIINNRPLNRKKQSFAVCVKGLEFLHDDLSIRLIEWIELLNILGVKKIFFYEFDIHPNMSKVLQYYQNETKLVHVQKLSLPGSQPNFPLERKKYLQQKIIHRRQNEIIPYNDCYYKNIYLYDYIVLLDIDEIIIPLQHLNWLDMIYDLEKYFANINQSYDALSARHIYFLDDLDENNNTIQSNLSIVPSYLHMLTHIYRSSNYTKTGSYVKSFFHTERILAVHNHYPLICFSKCQTREINVTLAHLQHYRKDCVYLLQKSCQNDHRLNRIRDANIWRFKNPLIQRTSLLLRKLNFLL
ncbi:unnamed protein product [Adineta steineri]|uniref:Glycosyltransferase family 92 protein n=1 Tax=Adineta steineri TaxID=433720 RepID=A0A815E7R2_9BILA|nr:unnamed protein product [Adineta steineri]